MLTTILWFIVVGAIVGVVARLVVPGRNPIGVLLTLLVGIAGAVVGGALADALGAGDVIAFLVAVVASAIVVALLTGYRGGLSRYRGGAGGRRWGAGRSRRRVM